MIRDGAVRFIGFRYVPVRLRRRDARENRQGRGRKDGRDRGTEGGVERSCQFVLKRHHRVICCMHSST